MLILLMAHARLQLCTIFFIVQARLQQHRTAIILMVAPACNVLLINCRLLSVYIYSS
jgi:hypothetical protein